ncbi:S-adenosyl-L-methionine-dependent methyltransferase [Echria macrotheca]|uniref:S-adenosyl-L-methionine-dependent methyltransferase n=1 Tax=Echria macrotheca TaxID=438768 RepID=A0AAJ0EZZ8_9PEZI|nr:S-adenosyl-L-methionine-dependent methyltransferase [Echria macrotheca]
MTDSPTTGQPPTAVASAPAPLVADEAPADDTGSTMYEDEDAVSSLASLASSILEYRAIHGRTFNSARYESTYFTPNDERQNQDIDITHHYMMLLLDGKLTMAPIKPDVQNVIDVGTGNGVWAIDFADAHPSAKPSWVPPNLKFELDDATKAWAYPDNTFDFVYIRFFAGGIKDWTFLFCEAYSGGIKIGSPFNVIDDDLQEKAIREAGFDVVEAVTLKAPVGPWTADKKPAEVGRYVSLALESDMEGYTLFFATQVLGWLKEKHQEFIVSIRKMIRNYRNVYTYFLARYVWGQKPAA